MIDIFEKFVLMGCEEIDGEIWNEYSIKEN